MQKLTIKYARLVSKTSIGELDIGAIDGIPR